MEKKLAYIIAGVVIIIALCRNFGCSSNSSTEGFNDATDSFVYDRDYRSFVGTYEADLTLVQSGHKTTIVLNPDGTGYFKNTYEYSDGDSYKSYYWWPADNGGGIKFSGGSDEQNCYFMNKAKTKMYWGLNNYMNDRNGYKIRKVK